MSTDIATTHPQAANPFARAAANHTNAGTIAIEQERAIAEAQGKLVIAKRFPRDQAAAFQRAMDAASRKGFAEEALYAFPKGGKTVSGPSIRMAEELARCWGNIDYGLRELSRRDGESEYEAYAWDLETNTMSSQKFTVKHIRDKQGGGQALTDERDIYEIGANMGARRMRARILALLPGDLVDAAVLQVSKTLAGQSDKPLGDRIRDLVSAFAKLDVPSKLIEKRAGKKLDELTGEDLVELRSVYKSISDGMTKPSAWFGDQVEPKTDAAKAINERVKTAAKDAPKPAAEKPAEAVAAEQSETQPNADASDF